MENFFYGKKFLVTGGASFIGSRLVDKLVSKNAEITVVVDFLIIVANSLRKFLNCK